LIFLVWKKSAIFVTAAEGKQARSDLEDLRRSLPEIILKATNDAAAKAAQAVSEQYNQVLKNVAGERDKAINERDIERIGRENAEKERDLAKSEIVEVEKERDMARGERDKAEKENAALLKENRALKDFIKNNL